MLCALHRKSSHPEMLTGVATDSGWALCMRVYGGLGGGQRIPVLQYTFHQIKLLSFTHIVLPIGLDLNSLVSTAQPNWATLHDVQFTSENFSSFLSLFFFPLCVI